MVEMTLVDRRPYRQRESRSVAGDGTPRGIEPFLLLELARGEAHGYELAQAVAALGFRRASEDPSILYKLLRGFEEDGLAESHWKTPSSGPARRMYRLTPAGRRYLDERVIDLQKQADRIASFLDQYKKLLRSRAKSTSRVMERQRESR
jgi:DNA-binding PadR family transcriptional regulator